VLSFGDLVILVGLADVAANLLLARRRPTAEAGGSTDEPDAPPPAPGVPDGGAPARARRHIPQFEPILVDEPVRVLVDA
jgi:hypothetical protein